MHSVRTGASITCLCISLTCAALFAWGAIAPQAPAYTPDTPVEFRGFLLALALTAAGGSLVLRKSETAPSLTALGIFALGIGSVVTLITLATLVFH